MDDLETVTLWSISPKYINKATGMTYIKIKGNYYFLRKYHKWSYKLVKSGALNKFTPI